MTRPHPDIMRHFAVTDPSCVAETVLARVWRVIRKDGSPAALKVYRPGMDTEATGFALMRHLNGRGAARIYDQTDTAVLMEWLDGPSLGDLLRGGQIAQADDQLLQVAKAIHMHGASAPVLFETINDWFADLFASRFAPTVPATMRKTLNRASALAQHLLATAGPATPLHGDLHHDNVRGSNRGFLAFDAKGVLGDRHYDLANAFRNPVGAALVYTNPAIVAQRATSWAQGFDTTPGQLLHWAAAHCALSISWTAQGLFTEDHAAEVRLIDTFFKLIDAGD